MLRMTLRMAPFGDMNVADPRRRTARLTEDACGNLRQEEIGLTEL